jgi:hypothetical protein
VRTAVGSVSEVTMVKVAEPSTRRLGHGSRSAAGRSRRAPGREVVEVMTRR